MADIKQAALWMKNGQKVWRGSNKAGFLIANGEAISRYAEYLGKLRGPDACNLKITDLMADDWEIAE